MSRKNRNSGNEPKLAVGKVMPLLDLIKLCQQHGISRIWVQTSCPPVHLPVDMAFIIERETEMFKSRRYHAIWIEVTTNHSINSGSIHCKYVKYNHAEKPPYAQGHAKEEADRQKEIRIKKLLKTIKHESNAKDQNLHRESIGRIRERRTLR